SQCAPSLETHYAALAFRQIPAGKAARGVAVDVREPLRRGPHAHERLDLFRCAGLAHHLDPAVSLSDRGDEAHAVACGCLWELGYVLSAHVYYGQRIAHRVARIRTDRRIRSAGLPTRARAAMYAACGLPRLGRETHDRCVHQRFPRSLNIREHGLDGPPLERRAGRRAPAHERVRIDAWT